MFKDWNWKNDFPWDYSNKLADTDGILRTPLADVDVDKLYTLLNGPRYHNSSFIPHSYIEKLLADENLCTNSNNLMVRALAIHELVYSGYLGKVKTDELPFLKVEEIELAKGGLPGEASRPIELNAYELTQKGFMLSQRPRAA